MSDLTTNQIKEEDMLPFNDQHFYFLTSQKCIKIYKNFLAIDKLNAQFLVLYVYYIPLHVSSTMCSSSVVKNCTAQHLVSSHLWVAVRCKG